MEGCLPERGCWLGALVGICGSKEGERESAAAIVGEKQLGLGLGLGNKREIIYGVS